MCGIFGVRYFESPNNLSQESADIEKTFLEALAHRGPESNKVLEVSSKLITGHTRLAFNDLTDNGVQPISDDVSVISFNGEMYNFKEIKNHLSRLGYNFFSNSDTEVLQKTINHFGTRGLHQINGMFAISYFDKKSNVLYLIRDRFGVKPLYYTIQKKFIVYSSEIKPLLKYIKKLDFDEDAVKNYINHTATDYNSHTFIREIQQVEPGCLLKIDDTSVKQERWYDLKKADIKKKIFDLEEFENLLVDAIKIRLDSDVDPAISLSGGVDSSVIYTLIKERLKKKVKIFTYHNTENEFSEIDSVLEITSKYGDELTVIPAPKGTVQIQDMNYDLLTAEMPSWSFSMWGYGQFYKAIRAQGVKMIIEGHGSDEIFAGYSSQILDYLHTKDVKSSLISYYKLYVAYLKMTKNTLQQSAFKILQEIKYRFVKINKLGQFRNFNEIILDSIFYRYLPIVLRTFDRASMQNSIESRSPFLDYRIVEYVLSLSDENRFSKEGTKKALRDILEKYDNKFISSKNLKMGFTLDYRTVFLESKNREIIKNKILKSQILNSYSKQQQLAIGKINNNKIYEWEAFDIGKLYFVALFEEYYKQIFSEFESNKNKNLD